MDEPDGPAALAHLLAHREGTLLADETAWPMRFVADPGSGRLVFPAPGAVLAAESLVLLVPEENPADGEELQLMLAARELDPGHEAGDRWRAYHGEPRLTVWAICEVEGARFRGAVVEHEALNAANPLRAFEGRLCKRLNADRAALAAACRRMSGVEIREPLAVGVDALGFDVRARFGIVRMPFDREAASADDAERIIDSLLRPAP